jgi:hypothetical protein
VHKSMRPLRAALHGRDESSLRPKLHFVTSHHRHDVGRRYGFVIYDDDIEYRAGPSRDCREVVLKERQECSRRGKEDAKEGNSLLEIKVWKTLEIRETMLDSNDGAAKESGLSYSRFHSVTSSAPSYCWSKLIYRHMITRTPLLSFLGCAVIRS